MLAEHASFCQNSLFWLRSCLPRSICVLGFEIFGTAQAGPQSSMRATLAEERGTLPWHETIESTGDNCQIYFKVSSVHINPLFGTDMNNTC